jgi:hypothetical protein
MHCSSIFVNNISDNQQGNCPGFTELSLELQKSEDRNVILREDNKIATGGAI